MQKEGEVMNKEAGALDSHWVAATIESGLRQMLPGVRFHHAFADHSGHLVTGLWKTKTGAKIARKQAVTTAEDQPLRKDVAHHIALDEKRREILRIKTANPVNLHFGASYSPNGSGQTFDHGVNDGHHQHHRQHHGLTNKS